MKIAITGSGGFVGSHTMKYFSQKHEIIAFQRQRDAIQEGIIYKKWDLRDTFSNSFDCDIFIHIAADTAYEKSRKELLRNNVLTMYNVLDLVNRSGCKHFIYISSSSVYQGLSGVIQETAILSESQITNSYAFSKYLGERILVKNIKKDMKLTILRPRAIYGEGDRILLPQILKYIYGKRLLLPGNGLYKTSVTGIQNLCECIDLVIQKQKTLFEIFNLADNNPLDYKSIYTLIQYKYNLKGIVFIPAWIIHILAFFSKNKWGYLRDTFLSNKILDTSKIRSFGYNDLDSLSNFLQK